MVLMAIETVPPPAPAVVPSTETPPVHGVTRLFVGVVAIAALYLGHDVFVPIVIAVLLSFVLAPFVELLRRIGLGRVPSVLIAVLVALGIIVGLASIIGTQIASLATDLPRYEATIADKLATVRNATLGRRL